MRLNSRRTLWKLFVVKWRIYQTYVTASLTHIRKCRVKTLSCLTSVLKTFTTLRSRFFSNTFSFFLFSLAYHFFGIDSVIMAKISLFNEGLPASPVMVRMFLNEECHLKLSKHTNGHCNLTVNYL